MLLFAKEISCSANTALPSITSHQDSQESCCFCAFGRGAGEQDSFNSRRPCSMQPRCSQRLLCLCCALLPLCANWLSTKPKSRAKRPLYMNRSMRASREGVISIGIRQCAWKAICWEAATCLASLGCSLPFATLLISLLDGVQPTASRWPPLHSSIKPPSFLIL